MSDMSDRERGGEGVRGWGAGKGLHPRVCVYSKRPGRAFLVCSRCPFRIKQRVVFFKHGSTQPVLSFRAPFLSFFAVFFQHGTAPAQHQMCNHQSAHVFNPCQRCTSVTPATLYSCHAVCILIQSGGTPPLLSHSLATHCLTATACLYPGYIYPESPFYGPHTFPTLPAYFALYMGRHSLACYNNTNGTIFITNIKLYIYVMLYNVRMFTQIVIDHPLIPRLSINHRRLLTDQSHCLLGC